MLIKRVYEFDPLGCPQCGGQMKVVAFIEPPQSDVIEKILRHCGLWFASSSPRARRPKTSTSTTRTATGRVIPPPRNLGNAPSWTRTPSGRPSDFPRRRSGPQTTAVRPPRDRPGICDLIGRKPHSRSPGIRQPTKQAVCVQSLRRRDVPPCSCAAGFGPGRWPAGRAGALPR